MPFVGLANVNPHQRPVTLESPVFHGIPLICGIKVGRFSRKAVAVALYGEQQRAL
jgi:hypothetical protein